VIRALLWAAGIAAAAAIAIALNLALLGSATAGHHEPVGQQSARTRLIHLQPSPGIRHPPPRHASGLEADD
jgi:hypothetical protein